MTLMMSEVSGRDEPSSSVKSDTYKINQKIDKLIVRLVGWQVTYKFANR